MKNCLSLSWTTVLIPRTTVVHNLCSVSRHRFPTFYLSFIIFVSSTHVVPRIPLKPPARVILVNPSLRFPDREGLAGIHLVVIELLVSRAIWRELGFRKPRFRKFFRLVFKVHPSKYTELKHFFGRQVWFKIGMKVAPLFFSTDVHVVGLHRVMYHHLSHSGSTVFCGSGKNALVFRLYSSKSGFPSNRFSSIGMPDTLRMRNVIMSGLTSAT